MKTILVSASAVLQHCDSGVTLLARCDHAGDIATTMLDSLKRSRLYCKATELNVLFMFDVASMVIIKRDADAMYDLYDAILGPWRLRLRLIANQNESNN